jgi:hypothetical protein
VTLRALYGPDCTSCKPGCLVTETGSDIADGCRQRAGHILWPDGMHAALAEVSTGKALT